MGHLLLVPLRYLLLTTENILKHENQAKHADDVRIDYIRHHTEDNGLSDVQG